MEKTLSSKMKILLVGPYPPPYSGPESSIKLLMESPFTKKADVRLFDINFRKDMNSKGKVDIGAFFAFFRIIFGLVRHIVTFRPDIVYYYVTATRMGWLYKDIWVILTARCFFRKVVIHMRAGHFKFNYEGSSRWVRFLIRFACSRCDMGLVQGEALRDQFEGLIPSEKIHVVNNMIDVEKYSAPHPLEYKQNRCFFMGHLSFAKGYCDLLAVVGDVVKEFPTAEFVFAGYQIASEKNIFRDQLTGEVLTAEDPKKCYDTFIAGKFESNYQYLGPIGEEQKIKELQNCAVFLLPSYSEGISMAVLEALSISRPVICTPVGALGEVVRSGENGIVVQPGDRQALSEAIRKILGDTELRHKMMLSNHEYVCSHFSKEIIAERLLSLFQTL